MKASVPLILNGSLASLLLIVACYLTIRSENKLEDNKNSEYGHEMLMIVVDNLVMEKLIQIWWDSPITYNASDASELNKTAREK